MLTSGILQERVLLHSWPTKTYKITQPQWLTGAITWVPFLAIIGTVIASRGVSALVSVFYPISRKDEEVLIEDMATMDGQYLQYVSGPNPNYTSIHSSGQGTAMRHWSTGMVVSR